MKKQSVLYVLTSGLLIASTVSAEPKMIYELPKEVAVCKENCMKFSVADCKNGIEREIISSIPIQGTNIIIKGRGTADAQTCDSGGRITAQFESTDGKISKSDEAIIKCKSSNNFTMQIPLTSLSKGELTVYSKVSDWCTAVTKLKVLVE